jgi:anaerobic magnesium-protoporphyrin IX monomethyl ester cyclase
VSTVLLTHSNHLRFDAKQMRKMQPYPPLGTLYAASALRSAGISVAVFDVMLAEDPFGGFARALEQHRPEIVVIYEDDFNFVTKMCLDHMRTTAHRLAELAHAQGATVVAHGSDATDHASEYLRNNVDYVLNGEAERALIDVCAELLQSRKPLNVAGVVSFDCDGKLRQSAESTAKNPSWTELPPPARDLIDMEPYRAAWTEAHGYFSTNVVSSRGCPYQCNWCAKPISGNKFRVRQPAAVAAEIHTLKVVHQVDHIWFGDDIFALDHRWIEEFAKEMELQGAVLPFKIQSRADLMSESTVAALKRAGCTEIWMGVESGSQKILDAMDKNLSLSDVYIARERLRKAGIRACYFIQFGYPGEGWAEIVETAEVIRQTRPDDIGVSLSYPLPGTRFYERVQAQLGSKRNWMNSDDLCIMFTAPYTDEFYRVLRDAMHAEVATWSSATAPTSHESAQQLWQRVVEMERYGRNPDALTLSDDMGEQPRFSSTGAPLVQLLAGTTES